MASGPITSWQTDGQTGEAVTDFIFLGCKITAEAEASTLWPPDVKNCLIGKDPDAGKE